MSELQINTTQNVKISFEASNLGERLGAFFIDMIIIIIYYSLVVSKYGFYEELDQWSNIAIRSLLWLPIFFYSVVQEIILEGQTIGKRILKIKVVKIDGYQASFTDYLVRWFFRIPDVYLLGLGFFILAFSKKTQRLGDMAAGTAVITLRDRVTIKNTILENLKEDYKPTYPTVIRLSDNDARIIKETFITARKTKDYQTLIKLRSRILEVTEIKGTKDNNDLKFIDTVLKDYNYYTQNM